MWTKRTLRFKLTVMTAVTLSVVAICLTLLILFMSRSSFVRPFEAGPIHIRQVVPPSFADGKPPAVLERDAMYQYVLASQRRLQYISVGLTVLVITIGTALVYMLAGRILKPLHLLTDTIHAVDERNLMPINEAKDATGEVLQLTRSFNTMLAKLSKAFADQKNFSQYVAHELKTPVTAMLVNIEVLEYQEQPNAEDYDEVMQVTKQNLLRLKAIVSSLLELNNQQPFDRGQQIEAKRFFEHIIEQYAADIAALQLTVSVQVDRALYGNQELLEKAFSNILSNAIRYNKTGGAIAISQAGGQIVITDTGVGIPAEALAEVFKPFYCVDPSRSRQVGGSGLGLAIVRTIIENHHGEVCIQSNLGEGTKVIVTLPQ